MALWHCSGSLSQEIAKKARHGPKFSDLMLPDDGPAVKDFLEERSGAWVLTSCEASCERLGPDFVRFHFPTLGCTSRLD